MPTMKDISKLAGVAYGTVSNVLNKRGNVSLEKIQLVMEAADKLGYYKNERAGALRSNKITEIALIIPTIADAELSSIYSLLFKKASQLGIKLNLCITGFNSDVEKEQFKLLMATNKFIIICTSLANPQEFYDTVNFSDTTLIFINSYSKMSKPNIYTIEYDLAQLSSDIGNYIQNNNYKDVLFFTDKRVMSNYFGQEVDILVSTQPFNLSTAIDALDKKNYDLVVVDSNKRFESIISAQEILQKAGTSDFVFISDNDIKYQLMGRQYILNLNLLIEQVFSIVDGETRPNCITLACDGFFSLKRQNDSSQFINILMAESPATNALLKIKPFIEDQLGFKINIDVIKYNQYDVFMLPETIKKYDLIRIDMAKLGELASAVFKPLDKAKFSSFFDRFIDNLEGYSYFNDTLYSLPFDISCMVMMYRKDILDNQFIQREYYEKTKRTEIIPKSFSDYNNLERFFAENYGSIFVPSTVCIGSNVARSNEFLVRMGDESKILDENGELNLAESEVGEALKSYLYSVAHSKSKNNFWDDVVREYAGGKTVMSIVYSNYIYMLKSFDEEIICKTNYSFPPSQKTLIGGGIIGLTLGTKKDDLCCQFLEVLYDERIGKLLAHLGATMPLKTIYSDIDLGFVYPWLGLIPKAMKTSTRIHFDSRGKQLNTVEFESRIGRLVKQEIEKNVGHR